MIDSQCSIVVYKRITFLLQIACIALLIGRGWQFLAKSTPFSTFFFNGILMTPVVKYIYGTDWTTYLNDPAWYSFYKKLVNSWGIFLFLMVPVVIGAKHIPRKWLGITMWLVGALMGFLAFCYCLSKGLQIGQFLEYGLQIGTPLFLFYILRSFPSSKLHSFTKFYSVVHPLRPLQRGTRRRQNPSRWTSGLEGGQGVECRALLCNLLCTLFWMKLALAATFIGHGLYAIGFHPLPGNFIDMMIKGFGMTESIAKTTLWIIGWLDILAAIALLCFPLISSRKGKQIYMIALYYTLIWGFLTALARVYTNVAWSSGWYSLKQWLPEFLMRFPHFLIPLTLILLLQINKKNHHKFP